jgi:hypothetical protein
MPKKISRANDQVGFCFRERPNPGNGPRMPRRQVQVAQVQNANRFASCIQNGQGLASQLEALTLGEDTPGCCPKGGGAQPSER